MSDRICRWCRASFPDRKYRECFILNNRAHSICGPPNPSASTTRDAVEENDFESLEVEALEIN
jgi:hypothetical protein